MSNISQWDTSAGGNTDTPPDGWPEGMARAAVNNSARENMAAIARWYAGTDGSLTSTGSSNAYVVSTGSSHAALADIGLLVFKANHANTGAATLAVDGLTAKAIKRSHDQDVSSGDIEADQIVIVVYNATDDVYELVSNVPIPDGTIGSDQLDTSLFRGHLSGLGMSNGTDADHDIDITVGVAMADDQSAFLELGTAITKQIDAGWALGDDAGGLDTGSVGNDTWYHVFIIRRSDTGVVDALFSTSVSSPTMPSNYDEKRRIGSVLTDGSANIIAFLQEGDQFLWSVPTLDVDETSPGSASELKTLTVPTGVKVIADTSWSLVETGATARQMYILSPDQADTAPTASSADIAIAGGERDHNRLPRRTNTSAQVRRRLAASGSNTIVRAVTHGWIDRRGRDD